MNRLFDKNAPQNVHGWERTASVAGGVMLLAKGLRRGGIGGLLELALGGMALARGITGRCEAKRMLGEQASAASGMASAGEPRPERYAHMPLDSEVHSPDFQDPDVRIPDATPMGHESRRGPTV
ncbi:YgaP-like transmembrane domain [Pseudomonas oligotrophica]|uniref:YgaP-like transmembrane domain n=1 Tax=Pseudomonas oligotrophica TaxID=2912055 RepID=UPI001F45161A|nr:YgaP-like transmembrane domain [Pseudomonas oligotrophica]MCF7202606.1 DUF2892 domain-containing protein [Pseudomonas oligotrophica]